MSFSHLILFCLWKDGPMGPVNFLWTTHGHKRNNARWKKKVLAVTDYWRYIILQYILCTTFLFVTVLSLHLKFVNITLSEPCSKLLKLMSEFFYFDLLQLVSFRIVYYLLCRMPLMKILAGSWGLQTILKSLISRTFVLRNLMKLEKYLVVGYFEQLQYCGGSKASHEM